MEKKVTTSPVAKKSSGFFTSPLGKKSTGTVNAPAGKKSTGTVNAPAGKKSTGTVNAPASNAKAPTGTKYETKTSAKPVDLHDVKKWCGDHMHRYVLVHTHDGWCCDGFVEHIDDEYLCVAVPHCGGADRDFFPGQYYPPLYPYPYYPRGRFYRQFFPVRSLLGLSLLPFF